MMTLLDVTSFYRELNNRGIEIWIDGGWGVDALLGKQTRQHNDLDIFIQEKDVSSLLNWCKSKGYREIKLEMARPFNFVYGDDAGHEVDVHVIVFNNEGNISYGEGDKREIFPAAALGGTGAINDLAVKCTSPEWIVKWHSGYKPPEQHYQDIKAVCREFSIKLPEEYRR